MILYARRTARAVWGRHFGTKGVVVCFALMFPISAGHRDNCIYPSLFLNLLRQITEFKLEVSPKTCNFGVDNGNTAQ